VRPFAVVRSPRHIVFGRDSVAAVGRLAAAHGDRALLCTDAQIARTPILATVLDALRAAGVDAEVFDGGVPDLPVEVLDDALAFAARARPAVVIGVGGGSSLDLAKLTALLLRHPAPIEDYYGENRVPGPVTPIVAVPTTAGTGSEVTPVAVVSDSGRVLKVGVSSEHLVPVACVCDPALTDGCPRTVTAHAGIDALAHAIEAFTAVRRDSESLTELPFARLFVGKNALSDTFALEAIRSIGRSLERAVHSPENTAARDGMAYGSLLAGLAFGSAGTAAAHALQYPIGARTGTPHGLGVGVLLPYAMEYNRSARVGELAAIATALGVGTAEIDDDAAASAAIDRVAGLAAAIGIPANTSELGVEADDLPGMADQAVTVTRLVENNARPLDRDSLLMLLKAAWSGDRAVLGDAAAVGGGVS
jgi:alcohol dehydrogenase class IV